MLGKGASISWYLHEGFVDRFGLDVVDCSHVNELAHKHIYLLSRTGFAEILIARAPRT